MPSAIRSESPRPAGLHALAARLLNRRGSTMFAKNALVSGFSFLIDLGLLWAMVSGLGWNKIIAAALGFVLANAIHYAIARGWVFQHSARGLLSGYAYFLMNAGAGLLIILSLFALLTDVAGIPYLIARVFASLCAGTIVFVLNAVFNFRLL